MPRRFFWLIPEGRLSMSVKHLAIVVCTCALVVSLLKPLGAQETPDQPAAAPAADEAAPAPPPEPKPLDRGDNAWVLTSSALVLMMTGPGLAMFYCGLVRKKNVLSVIMQCFFLMGLMSIVWALWGYSLAFGGSEAGIGNGDYLLMK